MELIEQFCVELGNELPANNGKVTMKINTVTHGTVEVGLTSEEYECIKSLHSKVCAATGTRCNHGTD